MNYQTCSTEELVEHVLNSTAQAITQQIAYYRQRGNDEVVTKIKMARLLARQKKLQKQMESLDAP